MRYLTLILSLFLFACSNGQSPVFAAYVDPTHAPAPTSGKKFAFWFWGESNSGGQGKNDSATVGELAVRNETYIFNNNLAGEPLEFQKLDIGTNNLVDHAGYSNANLNNASQHGWENQLANLTESDPYYDSTWIIKTGQGGTVVWPWINDTTGSEYYQKFVRRVDSARMFLGDRDYNSVCLISMGINNMNAATNPAHFKIHIQTFLTYARLHLPPGTIFIFTKFATTTYNGVFDELANEEPDVRVIESQGLGRIAGDPAHWGYSSVKAIVNMFSDVIKAEFP